MGKAGGFSHRGRGDGEGGPPPTSRPPQPPPAGGPAGLPAAASSPPELASAERFSMLRPGCSGSTLHVPRPPYTICRAAEQNFLINKQDLGFHFGEAMTEEGLGLSPLSAPGPANSSPPGRAERREEGEPGQEHIFWSWSHCLAAGRSASHFPRCPSRWPPGTLSPATTKPLPSQMQAPELG